MNVLVISNMYPSSQKPYSGIFVLNQVNAIKEKIINEDNLDFYYMKRKFTNKLGSIFKYLKFFVNFIFFIKRNKKFYDIVHVHYYFPTIYLALFYKAFINKSVKIIVTFHGGDINERKKHIFYTYPFKHIDTAIGVSKSLSKKIQKYELKGRVITLSAGINIIFTRIDGITKKYDITFVGSFYPIKGFDLFCSMLEKLDVPLRICIVGSGQQKHLLKNFLENTIHDIDLFENKSQNELVDIYNLSKFLVNTSRKEGFGLVLSESMACGTIPIATKTDGSREQIEDNVNGFLVDLDVNDDVTVENLISIIKTAFEMDENSYHMIAEKAIEYANTQKLNYISDEVIKLYKNVR